jgi:hypothetical protein
VETAAVSDHGGERSASNNVRLRAAVESSPSGLLMIDSTGGIVLVNREVERLFGYPREELLGKSVEKLVPERFRGSHPEYRAGFFARPSVRSMGAGRELYGLRKDGSEVPVEIGLTPVATEEGLFVISSVVDISARKQAEVRFRAAVESSPNGVVMIDEEGSILLVNREVERMFGYERQELLGSSIEKLVPERFRGSHPEYRAGFFARPSVRSMGAGRELYGLRKDGVEFPVEIGLNPIETDEGLVVLSSIVDISARKQAEAARQQLEDQLRQAQKLEAVGTLAGGIAHDFNNVLGAIVGYAELALDALPAGSPPVEDLQQVLQAAARGKQLVERILAFSRRQEPERAPLDLGKTVKDVLHLVRATLSAPVDLRERIAPGLPRVYADSTSVHQVLMNLATNALHAIAAGGRLEVTVEPTYVRDSLARSHPDLREGSYVLLSVHDDGIGMEPAVRERAFEPFFTTKAPGTGTGLGLAMVHGIMRDHDGAVLLDSEPGQGTTVRCFFPTLESGESPGALTAAAVPRGRGERILCVDDEPALALIGERRLRALGYEVETCTDAAGALAAFRADPNRYDLVVTDYLMPSMTGLDLARELVALRPDIRIVLLTGFLEKLAEGELQQIGIRCSLTKPLTWQDLAAAVRAVLDEGKGEGENPQSSKPSSHHLSPSSGG